MKFKFLTQNGNVCFSQKNPLPTVGIYKTRILCKDDYIGAFENLSVNGSTLNCGHFALFGDFLSQGLSEPVLRAFAKKVAAGNIQIKEIAFSLCAYGVKNLTAQEVKNRRVKLMNKLNAINISTMPTPKNDNFIVQAIWQKNKW